MPNELSLRLADAGDAQLILAWRNDPWIVSLSTSQRTVTPEEHARWFPGALNRSQCLLFIVEFDGAGAGTVRVDREGGSATITIYLLMHFTGAGRGPRALQLAVREAFDRWPELERIVAHVRKDNIPSLKAFSRVGFAEAPGESSAPPDHVALVRHKLAT